MKYICWNIAGIRAKLKKGYLDFLLEEDFDVVCLQETKGTEEQIEKVMSESLKMLYPYRYWVSCNGEGDQRKGLNGVAIWSKIQASWATQMPFAENEGRTLALDIGSYIIVCVYTPNSQYKGSDRNHMRENEWDPIFRQWINDLNKRKPTIVCGDFNIARTDIDVAQPDKWAGAAGLLPGERSNFEALLNTGWIDSFREMHLGGTDHYTYWNQRCPWERKANIGWRIDYFLVPSGLRTAIKSCQIWADVHGSDHCPIILDIKNIKRRKLVVMPPKPQQIISATDYGWHSFLEEEKQKQYFIQLMSFLEDEEKKHTILPPKNDIFAAFDLCALDDVRVVIIGQDPYHNPGQAHGLAFSVRKDVAIPPSLQNIFKHCHDDVGTILKPTHGNLEKWSKQGVLLLNTVLTVQQGAANSHKNQGWEIFTDAVINKLNQDKDGLVFLLWGTSAHKKAESVSCKKHMIIKSSHPSPLGATKTTHPFMSSYCFSKTNKYLINKGLDPINWSV